MKNIRWKKTLPKILALAVVVGLGFILLPIHQAHASLFGIVGDFAAKAIGAIFQGVIYIIALLAGIFIAIILWFVEIVLAMSGNVANTTLVQTGFSASLSIANLGFVLGIIVVALATILRRETYGIKSILWKLVLMAILVNFALVIANPIIGFSNSLTRYFLSGLPGGGSGLVSLNQQTGQGQVDVQGWKGYNNLANGIANLFSPQRLIAPENAASSSQAMNGLGSAINTANQLQTTAGSLSSAVIGGILGLVMAVICLFLMLIILLVFLFMLLVRYIYIAFLLILAPFAWMLWVFPKTSKYFSQWWDNFIRWTFFAPIVMFFMWLIIYTGNQMKWGDNVVAGSTGNTGLGVFGQVFANAVLVSTVGTVLNSIVIIGLMFGGMYVANKMSITGASVALGAAKGVGKAVGTYAGQRSAAFAAKRIQPKPRIHPRTGLPLPPSNKFQAWRGAVANSLNKAAGTSKSVMQGGLALAVWNGAKKGSGLFGKDRSWVCQNCAKVGLTPHIIKSAKKPTMNCPNCGAVPAVADWQ